MQAKCRGDREFLSTHLQSHPSCDSKYFMTALYGVKRSEENKYILRFNGSELTLKS